MEGQIPVATGKKLSVEEIEKLQFGSCFVIKFVEYFMTKFAEYKGNIKPGQSSSKESSVLTAVSWIAGGLVGGALGGAFYYLTPVSSTLIAGGARVGKTGGEILSKYTMNKFQHKPKAKTVVSIVGKAASTGIIYDTADQQRLLTTILVETGIEIFRIFEAQFTTVSSAQSESTDRNMDKIALDVVTRIMDFLSKCDTSDEFSSDTIVEGVISGVSKKTTMFKFIPFFGNRGKTAKFDKAEEWNTTEMFEEVGVVVTSKKETLNGLYLKDKDKDKSDKYGIRLLASFEHKEFNKFIVKSGYTKKTQEVQSSNFIYSSDDLLSSLSDGVLHNFEKYNFEFRMGNQDQVLKYIKDQSTITNLMLEMYLGDGCNNWSNLHHAAFNGRLDVVKLILEANRDLLESRTGEGYTPLITAAAAQGGNPECVRYLLENGANVNAQDNNEDTPLKHALYSRAKGDEDVLSKLECLLEYGSDPNLVNKHGVPPIHVAMYFIPPPGKSNMPTVELLLRYGADITSTVKGDNLLHRLVPSWKESNMECFEILVNVNPSLLMMTNSNGLTPLQLVQNLLCSEDTSENSKRRLEHLITSYIHLT